MKNYRTHEYMKCLEALPTAVQHTAQSKFELFCDNPDARSLRRKKLRGQETYWRVYLGVDHRAIYRHGEREGDQDVYVWVWIGCRGQAPYGRLP